MHNRDRGISATGPHPTVSSSRLLVGAYVGASCPAQPLADKKRQGVYLPGASAGPEPRLLDDGHVGGGTLHEGFDDVVLVYEAMRGLTDWKDEAGMVHWHQLGGFGHGTRVRR